MTLPSTWVLCLSLNYTAASTWKRKLAAKWNLDFNMEIVSHKWQILSLTHSAVSARCTTCCGTAFPETTCYHTPISCKWEQMITRSSRLLDAAALCHLVLWVKWSDASCAPAAGLQKVRQSSSLRLVLEECVCVILSWILPSAVAAACWAPDVLWSRLHTHTHTQLVSLEQSPGFGDRGCVNCYLDSVQLFAQVHSQESSTASQMAVKWPVNGERKKNLSISIYLSINGQSNILSPFTRLVFVVWQAIYHPFLIVRSFTSSC